MRPWPTSTAALRADPPVSARGYSLVELVVAILILTVGILALAGTAGQVTRLVAWGSRSGTSAAAAGAQLETLRATPCAALAPSGSVVHGAYRLSWTVTASGSLRDLVLTVAYRDGSTTRTDVFETRRACP